MVTKLVALDPRHAPLQSMLTEGVAGLPCVLCGWLQHHASAEAVRGEEMEWSGRVNGQERPLCRVPDLALVSTTRSLLAPAGKTSLLGAFSLWGSQLNSRNPIALPGVAFSHLEGRMERRTESWADEKSQSRNAREQCRNDFGLGFQS